MNTLTIERVNVIKPKIDFDGLVDKLCEAFSISWQIEVNSRKELKQKSTFEELYRAGYNLYQNKKHTELFKRLEQNCFIKLALRERHLIKPITKNHRNFRLILSEHKKQNQVISKLPIDIWKVIFSFCDKASEVDVEDKVNQLVKQCIKVSDVMEGLLMYINNMICDKSFERILTRCIKKLLESQKDPESIRKKIWLDFWRFYCGESE